MINNPYKERYRAIMDNLQCNSPNAQQERARLMLDLYYALDEALGRIYELEQTLEGRENQVLTIDITDAQWEEFDD
jgi:hypothetical protein